MRRVWIAQQCKAWSTQCACIGTPDMEAILVLARAKNSIAIIHETRTRQGGVARGPAQGGRGAHLRAQILPQSVQADVQRRGIQGLVCLGQGDILSSSSDFSKIEIGRAPLLPSALHVSLRPLVIRWLRIKSAAIDNPEIMCHVSNDIHGSES